MALFLCFFNQVVLDSFAKSKESIFMNVKTTFGYMVITFYLGLCSTIFAQNQPQVVEIPDPNLRSVLREALSLSSNQPITRARLRALAHFVAGRRNIKDLAGLEHATNLTYLQIPNNEFSNLEPLTDLTKLETLYFYGNRNITDITPVRNMVNLTRISGDGCRVGSLKPLSKLTKLEVVAFGWNGNIESVEGLENLRQLKTLNVRQSLISDVQPLANITKIEWLDLSHNRIVNVTPLANLVNLKSLSIEHNLIVDHSPLNALDLVEFTRDECCEEPRLLINERLQNRTFPSVFSAWGGIGWSSVLNLKHESDLEQMTRHDLWWTGLGFGLQLRRDGEGIIKAMGYMERARQERDEYLAMNPNMLFLVEIRHRDRPPSTFPSDSPYWVRDAQGNRIQGFSNYWLIDFTHPDVQDMIVNSALAVAKCGLLDGVFFDSWAEHGVALTGFRTLEEETQAKVNIVRRIREGAGDNFLIIANGNRTKIPATGTYINGLFMETVGNRNYGYTHEELAQIESTLVWAEQNLRASQVNCLEGWSVESEPPDSPLNLAWMRLFTTVSLTHSDGFTLFIKWGQAPHAHFWYDFWDADLGRPVGEKGVQYENRDGLFIREFTNGWAVYNRSGETQQIHLSDEAIGVESGEHGKIHHLPDLDGEIYLKVLNRTPWDVNQDGITDIFDLIYVARRFGKDNRDADLNGDGTVDIFDLVLVAKHLGDSSNPAAPDIGASPHLLSSKTVQGWIDMAHVADDGSLAFRQGIANLKRLLTALVPDNTVLLSNYPNPFNPETWIPYHLAADADVTVTIYNLQGRLVRQLDLGLQEAGYYVDKSRAVHWDGTNEDGESVASGVYFVKLDAGEFTASKRMVVVK